MLAAALLILGMISRLLFLLLLIAAVGDMSAWMYHAYGLSPPFGAVVKNRTLLDNMYGRQFWKPIGHVPHFYCGRRMENGTIDPDRNATHCYLPAFNATGQKYYMNYGLGLIQCGA